MVNHPEWNLPFYIFSWTRTGKTPQSPVNNRQQEDGVRLNKTDNNIPYYLSGIRRLAAVIDNLPRISFKILFFVRVDGTRFQSCHFLFRLVVHFDNISSRLDFMLSVLLTVQTSLGQYELGIHGDIHFPFR